MSYSFFRKYFTILGEISGSCSNEFEDSCLLSTAPCSFVYNDRLLEELTASNIWAMRKSHMEVLV
jgi:hypothetical protein